MKKLVKTLAFVLIFAFIFGAVPVFAAEEKPLYVVLGDSIGRGSGLDNRSVAAFGAIVANSNAYDYKNFAVGGYEATDVLADLQKDEVREAVINADIISLSVGGNDFLHYYGGLHVAAGLIFGNYELFNAAAKAFYESFSELMSEIKSLNSSAFITVQTLYNPRYDFMRDTYQVGADMINEVFDKYLSENPDAFVIVDVAAAFDGDESLISVDQTHPNAKGHEVIAKEILLCLYDAGYGTATDIVLIEKGIDGEEDFFEMLLRTMINMLLHYFVIFTR